MNRNDDSRSVREYLDRLATCLQESSTVALEAYVDLLVDAGLHGRRVFLYGNGGSAHLAQHHAQDLVKAVAVAGGPGIRATALVDNVGLTTAVANDHDYSDVFVLPLRTLADPGDVAVAISCSGTSPNVVAAHCWAVANGLVTVAFTGAGGGAVGPASTVWVEAASAGYGAIEDTHQAMLHAAAFEVGRRLVPGGTGATLSDASVGSGEHPGGATGG